MVTFSILGMNLFGCKFCEKDKDGDQDCDRKNFDTLLWAFVTVFQVFNIFNLKVLNRQTRNRLNSQTFTKRFRGSVSTDDSMTNSVTQHCHCVGFSPNHAYTTTVHCCKLTSLQQGSKPIPLVPTLAALCDV